jgi:hypothetical protein
MSPEDYIAAIKEALAYSPAVQDWTVISEMYLSSRGHFRVRFTLVNGDFVEASEFFCLQGNTIEQHRYRYQWMDAGQQQLKKRWDNAPHFRQVETFPHHVHIGQDNRVEPSQPFGIAELVALIEQDISS